MTTSLFDTGLILPQRSLKPRKNGITMVMDKGFSLNEAANLIDSSAHLIDFVKLGFGTSVFTNNVENKIKLYKEANINVYLGGTLFEAFIKQNKLDDYRRLLDKWGLDAIEVSDGSLEMAREDKCKYISMLSKDRLVLSEVGSKDASKLIKAEDWAEMMEEELAAGSFKVIAEAREGGNVGIYDGGGAIHEDLLDAILLRVKQEDIIWETPNKNQQIWFIKRFGAEVNVGNIACNEVIALETLRNGLRGDTFNFF